MTFDQKASGKDKAQELLFDIPLYGASKFNSTLEVYKFLPVDGYCPYCKSNSTFSGTTMSAGEGRIQVTCARNKSHDLVFYFRNHPTDGGLMKVGQYPSYVDLKKDETTTYSKAFNDENRSEFRKATVLAGHGMGIGSYVYLRRIFERLVQTRFDELKSDRGWKDTDFPFHMKDKISFLKDHLPDILVNNPAIYGLLSEGVHQLDENRCLSQLPVLQKAIIFIVRDDLRKKQEAREREELQRELQRAFSDTFKPDPSGGE